METHQPNIIRNKGNKLKFILTTFLQKNFHAKISFLSSQIEKIISGLKILKIRTILDIIHTFRTIRTIRKKNKKNPYNPYILDYSEI